MARNPDATVRILDLTTEALAQLATLVGGGGGGGGTVAQGAPGPDPWPVSDADALVALGAVLGALAAVTGTRADGVTSIEVADDCQELEAHHLTLTPSTDTEVTFTAPVRIVRVLNWSTSARVLVKDGAIVDDVDPDATRVGVAPTASVPGSRTLPFLTASIHVQSTAAAEVSIEGYR